jgi:tRNA dimethylallyltransferase
MSARPVVVALVGATGTGKSDLAVVVGEALGGEIISVDSRLIYRGMDIGTDKPSAVQRRRVPHHLIDVADPDETWSLAQYQRQVVRLVAEISGRGRLPLLVGGTGQHMRAVLEGWSPPPRPVDPALRHALEAEAEIEGGAALFERLRRVDPESAARLDPRNVRRVIRALEIHELTGAPASRQRRRVPVTFEAVTIGLNLPRPVLYARIDARIDRMLADGLVEEVRALLSRGYTRELPSMSAIGYRQLAGYLEGDYDFEEAVRRLRRATRSLVRRQSNWFRPGDPSIRWFTPSPGYEGDVMQVLRGELGGR